MIHCRYFQGGNDTPKEKGLPTIIIDFSIKLDPRIVWFLIQYEPSLLQGQSFVLS